MFWHAGNLGDSWTYLWVTIGIWLLSIFARVFWYNRASNFRQPYWFQGFDAEVNLLSGNVTKIVIHLVDDILVRPGQHFFLRFPSISPFDSHPFTVAWMNIEDGIDKKPAVVPTLTFFARSREGFTANLSGKVEKYGRESLSVWVDGPYGGIDAKLEAKYDQAVLIAGGIGITGCLPWLQHFVHCCRTDGDHTQLSSVKLVWVVHESSHIEWAGPYIQSLSESAGGLLEIEIHCSTLANEVDSSVLSKADSVDLEKAGSASKETMSATAPSAWQPLPGRPRMESITDSVTGGRVVVIGEYTLSLRIVAIPANQIRLWANQS